MSICCDYFFLCWIDCFADMKYWLVLLLFWHYWLCVCNLFVYCYCVFWVWMDSFFIDAKDSFNLFWLLIILLLLFMFLRLFMNLLLLLTLLYYKIFDYFRIINSFSLLSLTIKILIAYRNGYFLDLFCHLFILIDIINIPNFIPNYRHFLDRLLQYYNISQIILYSHILLFCTLH